ncbi:hypothetical protein [Dokdonella fugitiva]|uniref:hypothetical protein n=1 Tax=Dokdonella fugitiva TaxID=328517 RepID=UPI0015FC62AC|nr:hypothetical protein [Dokdonella fugitiva]MBA8883654.1 hypothetical protein [Dokdonella fugitiva]
MNIRLISLSLLLAVSGASAGAAAAGSGKPYFRYDKIRMETKHAYAFAHEERRGPSSTYVFLTTAPLDAQKVADAFDPGSEVNRQTGNMPGGYVRICVTPEGKECGLYFSHEGPSESFNMSGSGEFTLGHRTPGRIEGRWAMTTPDDFFGKTYDFDLPFAADVTAPSPGTKLGADGGEPGRAYSAYLAALAKGDLPALRRMLGESGRWQLPEDDEQQAKQGLKDLRDGKPVSVKIVSAMQREDHAVLRVEGVDRDEIKRAGRVLMAKGDNGWAVETDDLGSVD